MKDILMKICSAAYDGAASCETAKVITELISPYCERVYRDNMGNVICEVSSSGEKHVVLSAHMDKIGLVVTGIDRETGMLKINKAGGVDLRTLSAARVKVNGKKTLYGCITSTPPHLTSGDKKKVTPVEGLFVDTGLEFSQVSEYVSPGDRVEYYSPVTPLIGDRLTGAYMDNSAGCLAVIEAVKMIKERGTENSVTAVFTTREEVGKGGAQGAFFALQPDFAFITDVSFGSAPGIPPESSSPLGSGAMICISPILQREVSSLLIKKAEDENIPYTLEVMGARTATDSDVAVVAGKGIKTGLVSVPLLNMHTPVETLSLSDVKAVSDLLYLASKGE
ncbi:MAG: M20/M25/M40 family metallo-hydrolase [Clostridia bacterium]|nr:M20/M25/M40 family metallo-hydrolase [Clostridia bacterium]